MVIQRRFGGFDETESFIDVGDFNKFPEIETGDGLGHTNDGEKGTG
jgi:hypothetical protein